MSIQLQHVTKSFTSGAAAVKNISLEIEQGELFVLLGASGSGKSTLLRLIAGLTEMDGGRILLHGNDVTDLPPQQRNVGFVFQNYSLFRNMNVAQNIAFSLSIRHASHREQQSRVGELLDLIQLAGLEERMPWQLSGGQQQRIALARALAHRPEILLLDEPFGALDAKIRVQLRQNLREIQRKLGITMLLVTHDQEEAFELADRIGVIERGELLEVGTPSDLYRSPTHRFTATFLGSANLLRAHRNSQSVYVGNVALPVPPDSIHLENSDVEIFSRPEEVALAATPEGLQGHHFIGNGIIEELIFAGPVERAVIRLPHGDNADSSVVALVTHDDRHRLQLRAGANVAVGLKSYRLISA
jgi:ABC-type Fe3+/spermidine/putrescine transport system ATPase subunit